MDISAKEFLFGSIFLLSNKLQVLGDEYLEEITLKQWLLLIAIKVHDKEQPSLSDVAAFMGSTRQNVRKMLGTLAAKGYVNLSQSEQDKRNLSVALAPQTYRFFEEFEAKGNVFIEQLFDTVEPELLEGSRKTFAILFENIERMEQKNAL